MRRLLPPVLAALLLAACVGPKPEVRSASVAPPQDGKAIVTVVVVNRGGGDGQIEVRITLRDATGSVVARDEKTTVLKERETITVVLEVQVPADSGELKVDAEATYPPD